MSGNPPSPAPVGRERRGRRLRLADLPVGAKLGIILLVPLLGLIGLAGFAASVYAGQGGRIGDLRGVVAAGAEAGRVTDGLRRERLMLAVLQTADTAAAAGRARESFVAETARTDAALLIFRGRAAQVGRDDPARPALDRISSALDVLAPLRTRATAAEPDAPGQQFLAQYGQLVAELIALQQGIADRPAPAGVSAAARAAGWLAVAREELALVQVGVVRTAGTPAAQQSLVAHRAAYLDALRRFTEGAPASWRTRLEQVPVGEETAAVDRVLLGGAAATGGLPFERLAVAHLDGLRAVADLVDADTAAIVAAARDEQNRTIILGIALVLAIVAGSVGLVVIVGRSMAGALRLLQAAAWRVAYERLPQTVQALQEGGRPATVTDVPVGGRDEIGRVAEAFNAVQREAIRSAAEQSALRAGMSTMFVNLARRSQRLVDALVERLDLAERDEADPDRLAQLFAFDHLATRIRHDNQSLLVLAGVDASRPHRRPVRLLDLLRAAQSQIEDYPRIDFGRVEDDLALAPEAVDGIVHLLAELFDNAARHSPADRPVLVEAVRADDGVSIRVTDHGAGLTGERIEELNARLAEPPPLDVADSQRMGLSVVGRLAARHDLSVTLEPARDTAQADAAGGEPGRGGLVALVRLPAALLRAAPPVHPTRPDDNGHNAQNGAAHNGAAHNGAARSGSVHGGPGREGAGRGWRAVPQQRPPRPQQRPARSPALPGGEPVDVPHPRNGATVMPVRPGPSRSGQAFDPGPRIEPDGPTVEAEADVVRDMLAGHQRALGRFGAQSPLGAAKASQAVRAVRAAGTTGNGNTANPEGSSAS